MSELISIIVPAYNSIATIEACVDSIKAQTFGDWELILVDNGSTDGSFALIERVAAADSRISALRVPQKGVSNARNAGLDIARGEYICFVDSDDTVDNDYLECFNRHRHSDLVVCGYNVVSVGSDMSIKNTDRHCPESLDWKPGDSKAKLQHAFSNGYMHFCWNKLFKKRIISDNGLRFRRFPVNEDYIFVMEYLKHAKSISIIDAPLYHWIRVDKRETGVNSVPDNLLEIYNRAQQLTRDFFNDHEAADRIAYYSYELIIYKYYYCYRNARISRAELMAKLKEFHKNVFVAQAYEAYIPSTKGERILYQLAKNGWFRTHYLLTQKQLM